MTKKPIIAVDIDDVLAQGTESLRLEVNRRLGVNLEPKHYAVPGEYWGYYEAVWQQHGLQGRISMEELNPQMIKDQSHVPSFTEAYPVLARLKQDYDLVVVTARIPAFEEATHRWLKLHFADMFQGIYFAGHHNHAKNKGELCKELGVDWLIDDNIDHAHSALEKGIKVVLFGQYGWHIGKKVDEAVVRCNDWPAIGVMFDEQLGSRI